MLEIDRCANADGRAFRITGQLDSAAVRQLKRGLSGPAGDGGELILDLSGLEMCDDAGILMLDWLALLASRAEGRLVVVNPSESVRSLMERSPHLARGTIAMNHPAFRE